MPWAKPCASKSPSSITAIRSRTWRPSCRRCCRDSLPGFRPLDLGDADVAKAQVGSLVVPLDAEGACIASVALSCVVVGGAVVGPVHLLDAVDPRRDVPFAGHDGEREPFAILRALLAGRHTVVDGPGAEI